jgi:hypothetical protein
MSYEGFDTAEFDDVDRLWEDYEVAGIGSEYFGKVSSR